MFRRLVAWLRSLFYTEPEVALPAQSYFSEQVRAAVDRMNALADFRYRGRAHVLKLREFYSRRPRPWRPHA